jgi:hypothetical protein
VSLCSEFRVAHTKIPKEISNTEYRTYRYITGQQKKNKRNKQHGRQNIKTNNRTTQKTKEMSNTELRT